MVATMTALDAQPQRGVIWLLEIEAGEILSNWTHTAGRTITMEISIAQALTIHGAKIIHSATVDGEDALTERASVALVDANPGSFYHDTSTDVLYVSMPDSDSAWFHSILVEFWLYFTSGSHERGAEVVFNSRPYWPYVGRMAFSRQLGDIYGANLVVGTGALELVGGDSFDQLARQYEWESRSFKILQGGESLPYSQYRTVAGGVVHDVMWSDRGMTLTLRDYLEELEVEISGGTYATTDATTTYTFTGPESSGLVDASKTGTTIEATAATARVPIGKAKRLAYGELKGIEPVAIALSASEAIYSVAGHAIYSVDAVEVDGIKSSVGAYQASSFTWRYNLANGLIYIARVDSTIDLRSADIFVDFSGVVGSDDFLMANFADIVSNVLTRAGITRTLDATSLAESRFLAGLYDARIDWPDAIPVRQAIASICSSAGAFFFQRLDLGYQFTVWAPDMRNEVQIDEERGDYLDISAQGSASEVYTSVSVEYGRDPSRGVGAEWLTKTHTSAEAKAKIGRDNRLQWKSTLIGNFAGAACLARRLCRYGSQLPLVFDIETTVRVLGYDLLQAVLMDRDRLPHKDAATQIHSRITGISFDTATNRVRLTLDDQRVIGRQAFMVTGADQWTDATQEERDTTGYYTDDFALCDPADGRSHRQSLYW